MHELLKDPRLRIIFGVTLMVVLGVSSIIPILPDMGRAFGVGPEKIGWVVAAFTIPGVFLTPFLGMLADRWGRKLVLVPSMVLFALAGSACAFAPDFSSLLVLRLLQGVGASALGVLATTMLGDFWSGRELATVMGFNAGALSVGTAAYPFIGGLLGLFGWRYPFVLPLVALPLAWVVLTKLETVPSSRDEKFLSYLRGSLREMKTRTVLGLLLSALVTFVLLYGPLVTYYPVLLSSRFEASPFIIGLIISVSSFFTALASSQLGRLSAMVGEKRLIRVAYLLYAIAFGVTPFIGEKWWLLAPVTCFGLAQGLNIPSALTLLNTLAPGKYRGMFMAANATILRVGQSIGPLLMGGVYLLAGLEGVFLLASAMAVAMGLACFKLIR
ncbi:MFS transporter [Desulfohalovibrio reitneri]|uniref:MFS transporter n=1 Tax=Desulfohalovibrio reitneri TaxID=1307759 RepID=UPI0004A75F56|nr:MFS transporter [Desulfohalovibrio reitneri]